MFYRTQLLIVLVATLGMSSCKMTNDDIVDIPSCLVPIYNSFVSEQSNCQGAKVVAYAFQENEVFAMVEGECISDRSTSIYSQDCNQICLLGGIIGETECQGVDFFDEAIQVRIIWDVQ